MKKCLNAALLLCMGLASGSVAAQQGIGIGNAATDTSGFVGSLRAGKSNLVCAANKLVVGARHTDRAFVAPNSADGITTDYDPRCASISTDGATVTVTNDAGFTDYPGYDQPGTVNQNTCGANQVVGRIGGFDRDIAGIWLSSVQHVCYAMTLDANDWVKRSTTIAATQNIGVNEGNAVHTLRGPFCTNNNDTIGVGIVSQNGGEGYDGMQAQCAQFVQARFSAALNFTNFAWATTLGGAGWTAQLTHTSGNMAVRTPRPAGTNDTTQFESANELYVIPGAGYSATPIAPAGIASNTYVVITACTNATRTDEQDLACPLLVAGRPDIAVTLGTPAPVYSNYGQLQNIVLTATNVGPGATDGDDGFSVVATLPAGWTAGTLPANCVASGGNTVVTCALNPTPLAGSAAPGGNGGTVSFTIPVTVNSPTLSGTYTANAALGRSLPDGDADATNNDFNTANDTASAPLVFQKQPILRLRKALPLGRFAAADQFALSIAGTGGPANATTTGSGSTATGEALLNGSVGAVYTLSEAGAAGANLANYTSAYSCSNALAGGQTPNGNGTSFSLTAAAGDDLTCTFGNTRAPLADLAISKTNGVSTVSRGATTTYTIVVTNNGPDAVTGAILTDPAGSRQGLSCTTPPSCTGAACPGGLTLAQLESGVALGALANGATVTVTLSCTVN
ncbi:DUF11 domain-containing protein [Lysobacter sp. BMK333-48F3]|uniref:prealbumin-like fold domain-containing protein n=1 Tax=Lysobacter sp. BMK333-48F3 TaxID=2867962 RepID=UPI001C8BFF67|nr:DUF11 domain-containing protein [Lysobacter sp. BMK333-48F3]MBX9400917.1 DUF11 domain-containing protein [Lysobacter sp. BMK333-48F3]